MTPTPEMIALARRVAGHALCGPEKWKPGVKAGMYEDIMRGLADDEPLVLGPLAMALEITEMAAKLCEQLIPMPGAPRQLDGTYAQGAFDCATALRSFEHVEKEG